MPAAPAIEAHILEEAAEWAVTLRYDMPGAACRDAFERWRAQSPEHARAWEQAQGVFRTFEGIPAPVGKAVLGRAGRSAGRRDALRMLALGAIASSTGYWAWRDRPWRPWLADFRTAVGERLAVSLPDSSELVLNTSSAVDIAFDARRRRLQLLEGEILVSTHPDPAGMPRPFLVKTPLGTVQALGTRFALRLLDDGRVRVSVFAHAVRIAPESGGTRILSAGEQAIFTAEAVGQAQPVAESAAMWQHGMLLAQDMRLADVVAELARYRRGVLRCDPAVAEQRLSGSIALSDTDGALDLIASTLPVRVIRKTPLWVTVTARD